MIRRSLSLYLMVTQRSEILKVITLTITMTITQIIIVSMGYGVVDLIVVTPLLLVVMNMLLMMLRQSLMLE